MGEKFTNAIAGARDKLSTAAGETIRYRFASGEPATLEELVAIPGNSTFDVTDDYGAFQRVDSYDWLIDPAALRQGDAVHTPTRGDRIEWTIGDETRVFEVTAPGDGPPWRWADARRTTRRLHTKQVQ